MDLLLIITYASICIVVFKVFKIPLNKWSVPTAVLGGIFLIGALIFAMNYNHPFSENSREYFVTTPIVPTVKGRVIEVPVTGNKKLKAGDVLFRIDPEPFKYKLASLNAQLTAAKDDKKRAKRLVARKVGSQRDLDIATAKVDDFQAKYANAQYELKQTTVRAPASGYVTQVALRPGMMAVPLPLAPVMVFVHDEGHHLIGWYRQNSLLRLEAGNEAEVAFDALPGKVFSGEVSLVLPALVEGQIQPSGNLVNARRSTGPGRIPVLITINDPEFEPYAGRVPGGAFGQTAIYSEHFHHVAIMRRILLRMASWMNYLFPFH